MCQPPRDFFSLTSAPVLFAGLPDLSRPRVWRTGEPHVQPLGQFALRERCVPAPVAEGAAHVGAPDATP